MIGYTIAKHNTTRVVVTLEIPPDAQTNVERQDIAVRETAEYRTSKAKILAIEDAEGARYETATSAIYSVKPVPEDNVWSKMGGYGRPSVHSLSYGTGYQRKELSSGDNSLTWPVVYRVGETIEELTYDPDPKNVATEGIHFLLSRRVAELYGLAKLENGLFEAWHSNGQKKDEAFFVDGKYHGPRIIWYANGKKKFQGSYDNGKLHGSYKTWYETGSVSDERVSISGVPHGIHVSWHSNGQKSYEGMYDNGNECGTHITWYENGQMSTKHEYKNGVCHGPYLSWHPNGQMSEKYEYKNGVCHGLYVSWYSNGQMSEKREYENGLYHGPYLTWHPNGQKKCQGMYSRSIKCAPFLAWDESGNLVPEHTYDCMEISSITYPE